MEFTLHFAGGGTPSCVYARLPAPPVVTQAGIAASPSAGGPLGPAHYLLTFRIASGDACSQNPVLHSDVPWPLESYVRGRFRRLRFHQFLASGLEATRLDELIDDLDIGGGDATTKEDNQGKLDVNGVKRGKKHSGGRDDDYDYDDYDYDDDEEGDASSFMSSTSSSEGEEDESPIAYRKGAVSKRKLSTVSPLGDLRCIVPVASSGIFEFYLEYDDIEPKSSVSSADGDPRRKPRRKRGASVYILVEPRITALTPAICSSPLDVDTAPETIRRVPLDGIVIQTIIPKWLPTIDKWDPYLLGLQRQNYNFIHFAPLNVRGSSNSPYSLYDQLNFSPDLFVEGEKLTPTEREIQLRQVLNKARDQYGIYSVTDIVWNHTASNSDWLIEHPNAGYNLITSPHLNAAFDVDDAMVEFSGKLESLGLDPNINPNDYSKLDAIVNYFNEKILPTINLWEYYIVNVEDSVKELEELIKNKDTVLEQAKAKHHALIARFKSLPLAKMPAEGKAVVLKSCALIHSRSLSVRYAKKIKAEIALIFYSSFLDLNTANIESLLKEYSKIIDIINVENYAEHNRDINSIKDNVRNRSKYIRADPSGPKLGKITHDNPLVGSYFVRLPENERTSKFKKGQLALAVNGWIWNADPLVNFADPQSKAYLLREVIEWGDCVKLRFGDSPDDNPWLWERYEEYTRMMAKIFDGIRIDNCHSTPINVAAYLLDCAREENPDIYIFAELFTGSEENDYIFCERLGIHSLVREATNAHSADGLVGDLKNFGGGLPMGTMTVLPEYIPPFIVQGHYNQTIQNTSLSPIVARSLDINGQIQIDSDPCESSYFSVPRASKSLLSLEHSGSRLHALYIDCTHDNMMPNQVKTAEHTLPIAAIMAFSVSAIGSTLGFDEILPAHLDLVNLNGPNNKYPVPGTEIGISRAKSKLNKLHLRMARECMCTTNIWSHDGIVFIQRVNPYNGKGYFLAAFTKFNGGSNEYASGVPPIGLNGQVVKHYLSAKIRITGSREVENPSLTSGTYFKPIPSELDYYDGKTQEHSPFFKTRLDNEGTKNAVTVLECDMGQFTAGSIVVFETSPIEDINEIIEAKLKQDITKVGSLVDLVPLTPKHERQARDVSCLGPLGNIKMIRYMSVLTHPLVLYDWGEYLHNPHLPTPKSHDCLTKISSHLILEDIAIALFTCEDEERSRFPEFGTYHIEGYGNLPYCGLHGFYHYITTVIKRNNPNGDKFIDSLKYQDWPHDYITSRFERYAQRYPKNVGLRLLADWFKTQLDSVKSISFPYLRQHLFVVTILHAYFAIREKLLSLLIDSDVTNDLFDPERVVNYKNILLRDPETCSLSNFVKNIQITSSQLTSYGVSDLTPNGFPHDLPAPGSMAAGLRHFSQGYMRCWGRDVMISIRGLYIMNSRFDNSAAHIIAFASTLRHGLIPNLLDSGSRPRFNCRDAAWWFLYMVAEHCRACPEKVKFLETIVPRRFVPKKRYRGELNGPPPTNSQFLSSPINDPEDDKKPFVDTFCPLPNEDPNSPAFKYSNTLGQICYEIIERHFLGIDFKEYGAGPNIDHAMVDHGFYVNAGVNLDTGFVFGGNSDNCGTWMDKMGDSLKAGNRGKPATPRDGSAVEIVGLSKNVIHYFGEEVDGIEGGRDVFPWVGVPIKKSILEESRANRKLDGISKIEVSPKDISNVIKSQKDREDGYDQVLAFTEWESVLQQNFHAWFYVPAMDETDARVEKVGSTNHKLVNRRGIYKDCVNSSNEFTDYQLRCNVPIAMCVSPELFDRKAAKRCLETIKETLVGPVGIKTLDPSDWAYRADYDNANDGTDPSVAHGFNYHQGPEWVYPLGFFLRAYVRFFSKTNEGKVTSKKEIKRLYAYISRVLLTHKRKIVDNPYAGLPELTNSDGKHCNDSCESQAWSTSVMIELVYDMLSLL